MSTRTGSDADRRTAGPILGPDLGILIVRVAVGLLFMGHGLGKLFGWFGQGGVEGTGAFFKQVGYEPSEPLTIMTGIVELGAGLLLCLGLLIPLAAAAIIGDMINAAWVKSEAGFWIADEGYEYELVLIVLAVGLVVAGPGAYSVDRDREWVLGRAGGVGAALLLGLVSGAIMLIIRK